MIKMMIASSLLMFAMGTAYADPRDFSKELMPVPQAPTEKPSGDDGVTMLEIDPEVVYDIPFLSLIQDRAPIGLFWYTMNGDTRLCARLQIPTAGVPAFVGTCFSVDDLTQIPKFKEPTPAKDLGPSI